VWVSFVVPIAVLLATLLLQRLEAKLLGSPVRGDHPEHRVPHSGDSTPLTTVGHRESPPARPRRAARPSSARATA
jgi:hypothetical protein